MDKQSQPIIAMHSIMKSFGKICVLNELSLTVNQGEYVSIVGKSGCGKSTLLNIISTFDFADSGTYNISGRQVESKRDSSYASLRNSTFGFVFQSYCLINHLTVFENICIPLLYTKDDKENVVDIIKDTMQTLGIDKLADKHVQVLSGGEKQRVALCRAIVNNPRILVCDEPTGNLDAKSGNTIMDFLETLNHSKGTSVVLVTHNNEMAQRAHTVYSLQEGRLQIR